MHQRMVLFIACISVILLGSVSALAEYLPKADPVPGGIAQIPIGVQMKPTIDYQDHRVLVVPNGDESYAWLAVVGIPLTVQPGQHVIQIKHPRFIKQFFQVDEKVYPVTDPQMESVCPEPIFIEEMKQVRQENGVSNGILSYWSDSDPFKTGFIPPLRGEILCGFAVQCQTHGSIGSCHQGIDLVAEEGSPVKAVAAGVVLATGNHFNLGDSVIIDHGQGVISIYANLDNVQAKPKQYVAQGKVIGMVAQSKDEVLPFIHWAIVLNQVKVNPLLFVAEADIVTEQTDSNDS